MSLEDDKRKINKIKMYQELHEIRREIESIRDNHIHSIYVRLGKLEVKTKMMLSLLFLILGVLLMK
jgi:hypothetical protein